MNKFIVTISILALSISLGCSKEQQDSKSKAAPEATSPAKKPAPKSVKATPKNVKATPKPVKAASTKPSGSMGLEACRTNCNKLKDGARNACLRGCKDVGAAVKTVTAPATPKIAAPSAALKACRTACNKLDAGQRNACLRACK